MPVPNLPATKLYEFITSDFEGAWNAVAKTRPPGRGNMMFAREAMLLLEWAARFCVERPVALTQLTEALKKKEPRYFTALPGPCGDNRDFTLPYDPAQGPRQAQLLHALFDLIRNGLVHQGQQILVRLPDRRLFGISLSGVGAPLYPSRGRGRHLNYERDHYGHTVMFISPDRLYTDFKVAIAWSGILKRKRVRFKYLERRGRTKRQPRTASFDGYNFSSRQLRASLAAGNHVDLSGARKRLPASRAAGSVRISH